MSIWTERSIYKERDEENVNKSEEFKWVKDNTHKVEGTGSVRGIYTATEGFILSLLLKENDHRRPPPKKKKKI